MAADARDNVGEPGLGLDTVEPRRSNERIEGGGTFAAHIRTAEQPIFSA